jgi:branched-chain amino acid transport system substrate-binding protein
VKRNARFLALLISLGLAGAAIPIPSSAAPEPYPIHVILEQTGAFAFFGSKQAEALHAIETVVNATGGIKGRPVRFIIHDDATNPQTALQLVTQLSADKVPLIIGPAVAATCSAVSPAVQASGPVLFCFSPLIATTPRGFVFRGAPSVDDFQPLVVRYFLSHGMKNLALITTTDASGQSFDQKMDTTLARPEFRDVKIVARERFAPADISVSAQAARIKAAHPDAVLTYSVGPAFGTILHGLYDSGIDVPVYGSGSNMNVTQLQSYAAFRPKELIFNAIEGLVEDPNAPPAVRRQQSALTNAMKATGIRLEIGHVLTWDPTMMVIDALRKIGPGATPETLRAYLEQLQGWAGVEGIYNFSSGDQAGIGEASAALFRYSLTKNDWELIATGTRP